MGGDTRTHPVHLLYTAAAQHRQVRKGAGVEPAPVGSALHSVPEGFHGGEEGFRFRVVILAQLIEFAQKIFLLVREVDRGFNRQFDEHVARGTAAQGRQAASASVKWSGGTTRSSSETRRWVVSVPGSGPPRVWRVVCRVGAPWSQPEAKIGHARCPRHTRVTPSPRPTTTPTPSEQGTSGSGWRELYLP